jgi:hypothetical protein
MKKKKVLSDDYGRLLPREEVYKILYEILATTKKEDLFPEAYRRAVSNLERAGLIPPENPTPDQHQTQP